ncbi:D-alanyl-D-alanine carboxypeptidase/D-alanyl-D-alanine-endopeptidase [Kitasatospora sp. NPDC052896]|uniref:D-alanyl-D-alanine carboxypeptidase/D-alanyl-D-alanine endopeptidase n=1 Tax=Kitasatospora sp. NPDC052896 TaxID=3364061 RepID=UPI0037C6A021
MTRFRHRLVIPLAAASLLAGLLGMARADRPAGVTLRPATDSTLGADLDALLTDPRLAGAQAGVLVQDASTGETRYQHQADGLLLPASTLKLVTSAAATHALGADHRFGTDVLRAGELRGGVLDGDLVLRGGGDFSLQPGDLDGLARQVADAGVREVTGALVADDTRYDAERLGTGWAWDDLSDYYAPQISALTLAPTPDDDLGTALLTITPAAGAGRPATVQISPPDTPIHLNGHLETGSSGSETTISVRRRPGGNEVDLSGTVPAGSAPQQQLVTVDDPAGYAAAVFRADLARHGVTVDRPTAERATAAGATVVASHSSAALGELLAPLLKESNNGIAEHLAKELGYHARGLGSWQNGLQAVADYLHGLGIAPNAMRQRDGSGLTRYNAVTVRQMATLLRSAQSEPWFAAWYDALPVAGVPEPVGGTLADRMTGTAAAGNVRAKTGSMTGVYALAGYVTDPGGHRLVFSAAFNDTLGADPRPILDAIAVRLATGPAPRTPVAGPVARQPAARRHGPGFDPDRCGSAPHC